MKKVNSNMSIFKERDYTNPLSPSNSEVHMYGENAQIMCGTDSKGYETAKDQSPEELVLHASEGFIPLWKKNVILRWRFSPTMYDYFENPKGAMEQIKNLFSQGISAWGNAAPIKFSENNDTWDFEFIVRKDNCTPRGCTLASAFFPDSGRHQLVLYPKLFEQSIEEQIETIAHELGHIFGLRHFFAKVGEAAYPSVIFGEHKPFTIMNYGEKSKMTEQDRKDLKQLYEKVWNGELKEINGTRIVTFWPYNILGSMEF